MSFSLLLIRSWSRGLLGALALLGAVGAHAQAPAARPRPNQTPGSGFRCGFDEVQEAAFARQPGSKAAYEQFLAQAARLAGQRGALGAAPDVTVPVVVHIVFPIGGTQLTGIDDAQVADALRVLNEDFSKTNPDTLAVIPAFQSRVANVGFRFRLAKLDPAGNCTSGITRTCSVNAGGSADELLKREIHWDPTRYLNIWVIDGNAAISGYAYLPCTGGLLDGVVVRKQFFGTVGAASGNASSRVLSHEVGHHFGLLHTWGGASTPPGLPSNCGLSDGIADTPTTIGLTLALGVPNCPLNFTSCADPMTNQPILANVQNYMDYATCSNMFTTGQRAVMRASLALGCRSTLTSAANLAATGTNDGYQPPAGGCPPAVAIGTSPRQACSNQGGTGFARAFVGYGNNAALNAPGAQVQWVFTGGVPATSTQRYVQVAYYTPGIFPVTLTITPAGGAPVTRTEPQWIWAGGAGTGLSGAVNESFENPAFPNNFGPMDLRNWVADTLRTPLAYRWQRASGGALVAADGVACLKVPNVVVDALTTTSTFIVSPALDLSGFQGRPLRLSFRTSRADNPTLVYSGYDELRVEYGTNCGLNNSTVTNYVSPLLQVPGQAAQNGFVPTSAQQWNTITLPLNPLYIGASTYLTFRYRTTGGNPFYLDQVRIYDPTASATADEARARLAIGVYPNPMTAETAVHFILPTPAQAAVQLTDVLGREVARVPARKYGAGPQAIGLPPGSALVAGVYVVRLTLGDETFTTRVLVP